MCYTYIYFNNTHLSSTYAWYVSLYFQAEERSRVGVRLLGHLLRGASQRGGAQMEIIEIPLSERPVSVACCSVTGDLLVGCENTLVLFTLRRQNQENLVPEFSFLSKDQYPHSKIKNMLFFLVFFCWQLTAESESAECPELLLLKLSADFWSEWR